MLMRVSVGCMCVCLRPDWASVAGLSQTVAANLLVRMCQRAGVWNIWAVVSQTCWLACLFKKFEFISFTVRCPWIKIKTSSWRVLRQEGSHVVVGGECFCKCLFLILFHCKICVQIFWIDPQNSTFCVVQTLSEQHLDVGWVWVRCFKAGKRKCCSFKTSTSDNDWNVFCDLKNLVYNQTLKLAQCSHKLLALQILIVKLIPVIYSDWEGISLVALRNSLNLSRGNPNGRRNSRPWPVIQTPHWDLLISALSGCGLSQRAWKCLWNVLNSDIHDPCCVAWVSPHRPSLADSHVTSVQPNGPSLAYFTGREQEKPFKMMCTSDLLSCFVLLQQSFSRQEWPSWICSTNKN